jgi:hypothetical protein
MAARQKITINMVDDVTQMAEAWRVVPPGHMQMGIATPGHAQKGVIIAPDDVQKVVVLTEGVARSKRDKTAKVAVCRDLTHLLSSLVAIPYSHFPILCSPPHHHDCHTCGGCHGSMIRNSTRNSTRHRLCMTIS